MAGRGKGSLQSPSPTEEAGWPYMGFLPLGVGPSPWRVLAARGALSSVRGDQLSLKPGTSLGDIVISGSPLVKQPGFCGHSQGWSHLRREGVAWS